MLAKASVMARPELTSGSMRWIAGGILAVALCAFGAATDVARGDVPEPQEQRKPADSPYLLSGDRFLEDNVGVTLQLDWNGQDGVRAPTTHAGVLLGGEIGLAPLEQRIRPAVFTGFKLGSWADEEHGPAAAVAGARLRWSPLMWDIFDVYFVARADFDFDLRQGQTSVLRPGVGVGLRVARLLAVEVTWDITVPLGSPFGGTQYPHLVPIGISLGVLFDTCFACNRGESRQVHRDLTCRLYRAGMGKPRASDLCAAIPSALSAQSSLDAPHDGTRAFLEALQGQLHGDSAQRVGELRTLHQGLLRDWTDYQRRATQAAQRDRRLNEVWTYTPVPTELRRYLGCDPVEDAGPPTCEEVQN